MRLDSPKVKRAAGWIAAFALPVAIVQVVGWMSGSAGPAQASATSASQHETYAPAEDALRNIAIDEGARTRLAPSELATAERIDRLRPLPFGPTPMLHAPPQATVSQTPIINDVSDVIEPLVPTHVVDDAVPSFHLQGVMSGSGARAARALINGRVSELGQPVAGTDWILIEVNAEERQVVLKHERSARTITLTLKSPS